MIPRFAGFGSDSKFAIQRGYAPADIDDIIAIRVTY
jgi:hypothetical protein